MSFDSRESSRYTGAPVTLYLIQGATADTPIGPFAICDGETDIVRAGITYRPWTVKHGSLSHDGTLDKSDVTVTAALGTELDTLFLAYPPSQVVNLTIFEGHIGDAVTVANYPAVWLGRILSGGIKGNELELSCAPVSTSIKRPGLRRNYQIGCPHVLFGPQCGANKAAATVTRSVAAIDRNKITINTTLGITTYGLYKGGLLEWTNAATGIKELRTISDVGLGSAGVGTLITVRGMVRGLNVGNSLKATRGCNHQMGGCNQHSNIQNYGGQPFIPLENPLSQKNQFY